MNKSRWPHSKMKVTKSDLRNIGLCSKLQLASTQSVAKVKIKCVRNYQECESMNVRVFKDLRQIIRWKLGARGKWQVDLLLISPEKRSIRSCLPSSLVCDLFFTICFFQRETERKILFRIWHKNWGNKIQLALTLVPVT